MSAPYVTLSHCWGKPSSSRLVLKQNNLGDMIQELPYDRLTPVFQDAVTVTRHLGIQYLWIDALCIIQDSKSDWAGESVRMGDIYHHATLNIASTCSPDSNTPFLRSRPRQEEFEVQLPFSSSELGIDAGTVVLRPRQQEVRLVSGHLGQPLQSRAWCFQERVLSTRTVFFDELQFLWECRAGQQLESDMRRADLSHHFAKNHQGKRRTMRPYLKLSSQPEAEYLGTTGSTVYDENRRLSNFSKHWYPLLLEYCMRNIT